MADPHFRKLFIENGLANVIFLVLDAREGVLHITAYRKNRGKGDRVAPGRSAVYSADGSLASCIRRGKLEYQFSNKTGIPVMFDGGRQRTTEGPIFRIADGRN